MSFDSQKVKMNMNDTTFGILVHDFIIKLSIWKFTELQAKGHKRKAEGRTIQLT